MLVTLAQRLRTVVPSEAVVARVGGDEFVVLQGNVHGPAEAALLAENIKAALGDPYSVGSAVINISISAGHVVAEATIPLADLLRAADEASYRLKEHAPSRA